MGYSHREYLMPTVPGKKVYGCNKCKTHLARQEDIASKNFNGQHGRAFLFHSVVNVTKGPNEDRDMTTGRHTVCDISCAKCEQVVGWRYEYAYEEGQKYKEGKFILEKALLTDVA
ncbi:yippee-like protein [Atractiella rhizophila]|nr:yippee-like protein [Atractiella rhizophila]